MQDLQESCATVHYKSSQQEWPGQTTIKKAEKQENAHELALNPKPHWYLSGRRSQTINHPPLRFEKNTSVPQCPPRGLLPGLLCCPQGQ